MYQLVRMQLRRGPMEIWPTYLYEAFADLVAEYIYAPCAEYADWREVKDVIYNQGERSGWSGSRQKFARRWYEPRILPLLQLVMEGDGEADADSDFADYSVD